MIHGQLLIEEFNYAVERNKVPTFLAGRPTGELADVVDIVIEDPRYPLPSVRIRFRAGEMFDEWVRQMEKSRIVVATADALPPPPNGNGPGGLHIVGG